MIEDLQQIPVSNIKEYCNPFEAICWRDILEPITLEEVTQCLEKGNENLTGTDYSPWIEPNKVFREAHIQKVAWFVKYGFSEPIDIDVGIPNLGCNIDWMVTDGNHRLAAVIYREEVFKEHITVACNVAGSIDYAKDLGLWID